MKQNPNTSLIDFDTPLSESVLNLTTLSPLIDILFYQSGRDTNYPPN